MKPLGLGNDTKLAKIDRWIFKSRLNFAFVMTVSLLIWAAIIGGFFTVLNMAKRAICE